MAASTTPAGLPAEDEIRLLRAELRTSRARISELAAQLEDQRAAAARLQRDLLDAWGQLQAMRRTVSWRVTAPLRRARRRATR